MVRTGKTPSQASTDTSGQSGGGAASHKWHGDDRPRRRRASAVQVRPPALPAL